MSTGLTEKTSGSRVREVRRRFGLSQQKFADFLGVSRSYLGDIENDRCQPSRAFLTVITSRTDVSADWLMGGHGEISTSQEEELRTSDGVTWIPVPHELGKDEKRVGILLELLGSLDPRVREAILTDAISRASNAQQIADLTHAVQDLTAKLRA